MAVKVTLLFGVDMRSGCILKLNRTELREFCVRCPRLQ